MLMIIALHVTAALASLSLASAAYFRPSQIVLRAARLATLAMLGSGTMLVMNSRAHLLKSCVLGLALLTIVSLQLVLAKRKLAAAIRVDARQ